MARYKDRVHYWEIWNEQDGFFWNDSADAYVTLFDETSAAIKKEDPHALVMNGGFSMLKMPADFAFDDEFLTKADRTNWDIFAYHDYHSFSDQQLHRKWIADIYSKYHLALPIWMNEGGMHTIIHNNQHLQAVTLTKRLATAPSMGLDAYFIYDLKDDGTDPKEKEDRYGLLNYDCTPKPSFAAYQNLIHQLGGRKYLKTEKIDNADGSTLWEHLYAGRTPGDDQVAVLWIDNGDKYDPASMPIKFTQIQDVQLHENDPITMTVKFSQLKNPDVLDLMGNPVTHQSAPDGTLLTISNEPVYLLAKPTGDWKPIELPNTSH